MRANEDTSLSRAAMAWRLFCTLLGGHIVYHTSEAGPNWSSTTATETKDLMRVEQYTALLEIFTECEPNRVVRSCLEIRLHTSLSCTDLSSSQPTYAMAHTSGRLFRITRYQSSSQEPTLSIGSQATLDRTTPSLYKRDNRSCCFCRDGSRMNVGHSQPDHVEIMPFEDLHPLQIPCWS
jgi:hypothetical protein